MSNKYLEKIAGSAGEYARGVVSPAWMEANIAKKHGKQSPDGVWTNTKAHVKGYLRMGGRGIVHSAAGAGIGAGVGAGIGALAAKVGKFGKDVKVGGQAGAILGAYAGYRAGILHGNAVSLANQNKEMHKKYEDKK